MIDRSYAIAALIMCSAQLACPAHAGELGRTSRGTVSISVTIPQRVTIATSARDRSGANSDAYCVRTNGVASFHVQWAPSVADVAARRLSITELPSQCDVGSLMAKLVILDQERGASGQVKPEEPKTLLIVPD